MIKVKSIETGSPVPLGWGWGRHVSVPGQSCRYIVRHAGAVLVQESPEHPPVTELVQELENELLPVEDEDARRLEAIP